MRWIIGVLAGLVVLAGVAYAAFQVSPWPSVLLIRYAFAKDAETRNTALAKHVPEGVTALRDQRYGAGANAALDVFRPSGQTGALPAIVWIHGGAFVAGDRADVGEYLQLLAAKGYATVAVGYSLAPGAEYPTPVHEANDALGYIVANAERYGVNPERLFLAGDSAGAQIAAQLAAAIADPAYAAAVGVTPAVAADRLHGIVLFCGIYDTAGMSLDGPFGGLLKTVIWSYFGTEDPADPRLAQFSVGKHIAPGFPPAFVSVGNADPLAAQSVALAEAIRSAGVPVETLFFPADHTPPLPHEYQFNLDQAAGMEALDRLTAFLAERSAD